MRDKPNGNVYAYTNDGYWISVKPLSRVHNAYVVDCSPIAWLLLLSLIWTLLSELNMFDLIWFIYFSSICTVTFFALTIKANKGGRTNLKVASANNLRAKWSEIFLTVVCRIRKSSKQWWLEYIGANVSQMCFNQWLLEYTKRRHYSYLKM